MRKYVIGFILGAVLSFTLSANAEEIKSLVGKQVEGQVSVVVDGKEINVAAAIIDGSSYAPVRAVAEAVGKEVDWYEGKVILGSKEVAKMPETTPTQVIAEQPNIENLIYKNKIKKFVLNVGENKEVTNPPYYFTVVNGDEYISADALNDPYSVSVINDNGTRKVAFKYNGKEYVFYSSDNYLTGAESFDIDGRAVYKLSTLGLKATISGDTLIIDKQ